MDYLVKSFSFEEFLSAVQKAKRLTGFEQRDQNEVEVKNEFFFLKSEYKIKRINFYNIQYIERMKDYVKVFTSGDSKPVLSIPSLKLLETKLPGSKFQKFHDKNFI
jgi:two-component system, LytTR family, response regulator LytT